MRFTRTMRIAAPRARVWELMADTDRLNREVGLPPIRHEFRPRSVGGSEVFGTLEVGRLRLRFQELPFEWVRPDFYGVRRIFEGGPVAEFLSKFELTEEDGGTRVDCIVELLPRHRVASPLVRVFGQKSLNDLETACQAFNAYLTGKHSTPYPQHAGTPPVVRDRLERGVNALRALEADVAIVRRLSEHLEQSPPEDVTLLRPFALADAWGFERIAVLRTLLLASRREAGLLELRWRLLCPSCRGAAPENTARHLSALTSEVHCPSCNIHYDADFDQSVEVCFAVAPAVRPVEEAAYCRGGPGLTPHVLVQIALHPGETRTLPLSLPPGRYVLVSPQASQSVAMHVNTEEKADGAFCVELSKQEGTAILAATGTPTPDKATWTWTNQTAELATLRLESPEPIVPVATAALVTSLQAFRDQFSSEVLSPETELSVRQICVLFSDLKGSTAMYRERGDAPSYRAVRDHFQEMRRHIANHDGAVVKTIGDAVMATFTDPAQGLAAALAIQKAARDWPDRLTVKLGLHTGPAIAVNANDLLDYFGQTVNLAARLQSESLGGDIVIAAELMQDTRVSEQIEENDCRLEPFVREIRGLDAPLSLLRITLP